MSSQVRALAAKVDSVLMRLAPPRVGPWREDAFGSPARSKRTAAWLGVALGITFSVCFLTGLVSHLIQHPPDWFSWGTRPAGLYRVTQGVHVATGIASIPLLLAKLWTVYPRLWTWPPARGVAHLIERVSLVPLVGGSLFLLFTGWASITRWAPWSFSFPPAHYAVAWIAIGGLVIHVGAKLDATRVALSGRSAAPAAESTPPIGAEAPDLSGADLAPVAAPGPADEPCASVAARRLSRRGFLTAIGAATGLVTVATVGETVRPLASVSVLAPRDPRIGPQGVPVNKTAGSAGVTEAASDPSWMLAVQGAVAQPMFLGLDELHALPHYEAILPIACVDGWSSTAAWRGVRVRDLLAMAGARPGAEARVESLQEQGRPYSSSMLDAGQVGDPDTLLALELNGETLHVDHGFPTRLIGPNRPGVQQTKWVARVVVL